MASQADIDLNNKNYADAERAANAALASGNTVLAHEYHKTMQSIAETNQSLAKEVSAANDAWNRQYAASQASSAPAVVRDDSAERDRRATASSFLRDILTQYGMSDLAGNVESLINEWGTNAGVIAEKLRQTDSYKARFKGLINLQSKGITDVRNEAEYIQLESRYRQTFRDAGLQSYLGDAGSRTEQDAIARIVGDYSLSVNEVNDRIRDAQRIVGQDTPAEVRQAAERYYGIKDTDMVAYTLKLDNSTERINQMANAAMVGGLGANRYSLDIDRAAAELVAGGAQGQDIAVGQLSAGLAESQVVRDATKRLADIDQDTLTDSEVVRSQIGNDATAQTKIKKLQSRERARFSGTSGVTTTSLTGLGGV